VAATFRMGGSVHTNPGLFLMPILLAVPATTRVSCRVRSRGQISGASVTTAQRVKLLYHLARPTGVSISSAILKAAPPAALVVITPSVTPWANSAWVQITASTSEDWQLASVNMTEADVLLGYDEIEIDVGVGAGGSEVVITTVRAHVLQSSSSSFGIVMDPILVGKIPSGSRVAMRCRHRQAGTQAFNVALQYYGGSL